jgi:uncharacterized protein (TIGR02145 family)
MTDASGNVYPVVEIGNQCWTKENLHTSNYADGSVIPNITDSATWINLSSPAWCNYENNSGYDATYGKLYNWYTVADPRNVCPVGWHVPSDAEWTTLTYFLVGPSSAGGMMKTTSGWNPPNVGATNESGFSGLPGGSRNFYPFSFGFIGNYTAFWSSSEFSPADAICRVLTTSFSDLGNGSMPKLNGVSVRCLRD